MQLFADWIDQVYYSDVPEGLIILTTSHTLMKLHV